MKLEHLMKNMVACCGMTVQNLVGYIDTQESYRDKGRLHFGDPQRSRDEKINI